jgi:hypothetical protein
LFRTALGDYRMPVTPAHTLEEVLHVLKARLGLRPDEGLVARIDAVLFGGREATAADLERMEALRRDVSRRLRKRHGWVSTVRAWYRVPRLRGT